MTQKKNFYIAVNGDWECLVSHSVQEKKSAPTNKHPIILCHGVATNGQCFHLSKEVNLIDFLCDYGYHVYNINLRGVGGSFCKKDSSSNANFNFDDLLSDIPLIIDFILKHYQQYSPTNNQVHWLGHSMGALLMYAFLSRDKNNKNLIQSFISLSSPTELKYVGHPVLLDLLKLKPMVHFYLKLRKMSRFFSFLLSFSNTKYHNMIVNRHVIDRRTIARYLSQGVDDISLSLLEQFAEWLTNENMISADGDTDYNDMGKNIRTPILLMSGSYDSFCPPHALLKTYLDIPLPLKKKEMVILSKISGFHFDYCHAGIIMGKKVKQEVFPIIIDWLKRVS